MSPTASLSGWPAAPQPQPCHLPPVGMLNPPVAQSNLAYVTLLTKDNYQPGVIALAASLRRVNTMFPLIVMYTPTVSPACRAVLADHGCQLLEVTVFDPCTDGATNKYDYAHYLDCWTKLRMWEMTGYRRLVYLDADMVVLHNLDHLFALPGEFLASQGCYNLGGHALSPEREHRCYWSCSDAARACVDPYFNAGFFVMTPSLERLAQMKAALAKVDPTQFRFAEQDFLNEFFREEWSARRLPFTYNAVKYMKVRHADIWNLADIKVLHYVMKKPWSTGRITAELWDGVDLREMADLYDVWWEIYEEAIARRPLPAAGAGATAAVAPAEGLVREDSEAALRDLGASSVGNLHLLHREKEDPISDPDFEGSSGSSDDTNEPVARSTSGFIIEDTGSDSPHESCDDCDID